MKTPFLAVPALLLCTVSAPAVTYHYRYTFSDGSCVTGDFEAEYFKGEEFLYLLNPDPVVGFCYRDSGHAVVFEGVFDTFFGSIPADGSAEGLSLWANLDSGGSGMDQTFSYNDSGSGRAGVGDEKTGAGIFEPAGLGRWELSGGELAVPDGGGTVLLLAGVLVGMAGLKRPV